MMVLQALLGAFLRFSCLPLGLLGHLPLMLQVLISRICVRHAQPRVRAGMRSGWHEKR
jgi:hypothetical protein